MHVSRIRTLFAAAGLALGAVAATPAAADYDVSFVNIATGTTGGTFYPAGIALAKLISDNLPVRASATSSAGSVENVSLLKNDEANMALIQINVAQDALAGRGTFAGKAYEEMAVLSPMFRSVDHIVVATDASIENLSDLRGKRIAVGRAGSGTLETSEALLASVGLTLDDISPEYIGQGEALDALKNGVIDAAPVSGGLPVSALTEALTVGGDRLKVLPMTEAEQKAFIEETGWKVTQTIPAETYPDQSEPLVTTAHMALLMVPADFPEDLGHDILKLMFDNIDTLRAAHGVYNSVDKESVSDSLEQIKMPLAAGAEAYFGG